MRPTCEDCRFSLAIDEPKMFECRRMPPVVQYFSEYGFYNNYTSDRQTYVLNHHTAFPKVPGTHWCGELEEV